MFVFSSPLVQLSTIDYMHQLSSLCMLTMQPIYLLPEREWQYTCKQSFTLPRLVPTPSRLLPPPMPEHVDELSRIKLQQSFPDSYSNYEGSMCIQFCFFGHGKSVAVFFFIDDYFQIDRIHNFLLMCMSFL